MTLFHSIRRTPRVLFLFTVFAVGALATPQAGLAAPKHRAASHKAQINRKPAPGSPQARRLLAIEYVKQAAAAYDRGDYNRTIQLCDIAADWYPTYARAQVWMGAAYQKKHNYFQARMAYRWAKALAPGTPDAQRAERGLREIGRY